ncbi:hypothetical protein B0H16DRAFT_1324298 [Mycena metata]|uniref:ATP-dependent DNA helicase n=1 Tax=Mycena metata TaxID=1033252 RepID=A0AAD7N0R3_9AGAR|nr:hypothetical protein B0H16DRAFT_1324298 [Mycena metata]
MRQKTQTPEDAQLRSALENMRYGACTSDDLKFLRTRVASDRPGHPHLDTLKYRNVSVITALNIHKDTINQLGAERFARDTGQELVEFYSIDKLSSAAVDRKKWTGCQQAHFKSLGPNLQDELWKATPAATNEHIPGCLRLCVGMPVMIKANQATELCITKGQEATVVGWDSSVGPHGKKVLDTLFVRLVNPPRAVQIPDLPVNVVPIARTSLHITALLRDDSLLSLNREQVVVLPNFSMTDYASQGKSRNPNVVHLNNCKDHKAYYVALSRGNEAAHTVIVQGFDEKRITSGMSGFLRQEFRELEMLDEITKLRWKNKLPRSVTGVYRGQLLASYKKWAGDAYQDPAHFHPSIRFRQGAAPSSTSRPAKKQKTQVPQCVVSAVPAAPATLANMGTHSTVQYHTINTHSVQSSRDNGVRHLAVQYAGPTGLIWDNTNYSCSYDALFTPLASIWHDNPQQWTAILSNCSALFRLWALTKLQCPHPPETARDIVRRALFYQQPSNFPTGPRNVTLDKLFMAMTDSRPYGTAATWCEQCGWQAPGFTETLSQYVDVSMPNALKDRYPTGIQLSEWFAYHFDKLVRCCPMCPGGQRMRRQTFVSEVPPILVVAISIADLRLNEKLVLGTGNVAKTLRLRGLIYHSTDARHFTSVVVDRQSSMWYHDGITTGRLCQLIGNMRDIRDSRSLHFINNERLAAALYAEERGG